MKTQVRVHEGCHLLVREPFQGIPPACGKYGLELRRLGEQQSEVLAHLLAVR